VNLDEELSSSKRTKRNYFILSYAAYEESVT
jgi:hypothetical protein